MVRMMLAMPAKPITNTGIGRWMMVSNTLSHDSGAFRNSGELRPPTLMPNTVDEKYISTRATKKLGVARPIKPSI